MEATQTQDDSSRLQASQAAGPPNQHPESAAAGKRTESWTSKILGALVWLVFLYYIFVWNNLPAEGNLRWLITLAVVLIIGIVIVFSRRKKVKVFEVLSNFFVVMLIVFGAAIFSIYFVDQDQIILFKLFAIAYFSFLPAWLYLHFISIKGRTLWEEYVLNLYRLGADEYRHLPEPPMQSGFRIKWLNARKGEMVHPDQEIDKSLYEKKFEGLFGPVRPDSKGTFAVFRGENLWPVAIATLLISVGWVLVTQPESIFNKSALPDFSLSGRPPLPLESFRFAFLGAYFYVLQMLVRRYFQNDLKTSAYLSCTVRVIVVMLLVWAIEVVWSDPAQQAQRSLLAFIIGVFPHIGWQAIQALVKLPMKLVVPSLEQKFPLSELDGLNIWYESRLLEEGIEDMQNLATANLVDVMLNTRIPVDRLVDWVDQSILYLHLGEGGSEAAKKNRERLRMFGIRTATDLEDALAPDSQELRKLERLLNTNDSEPSILLSIRATFKNEPNLHHVRHWRSFAQGG